MTPNNRAVALAALLAATLAVPSANASTQRAVPFDEKVEKAGAIVIGRCVKSEARWDAKKRWILTYSTFKVEKSLKGHLNGEVTVVTPGGSIDGLHQETIGSPVFEPNEEQLLFVTNTSAGPSVLFLDQGAYDVATDARGEKIIAPIPSDAVRVDLQRGIAVAPEEPRSLKQFESEIRESSARVKANQMRIVRESQPKETIWDTVARNKALIALALAGIALATWQLLRTKG